MSLLLSVQCICVHSGVRDYRFTAELSRRIAGRTPCIKRDEFLIIGFPECSQQMNFLLKWWHKYGCYTAIKYEHQANESSLEIWRIFRRGSRTMAQGDLQVYLLYEGRMSSQIRRPKRMSIYAVPAVHLPHWTGLKTAKGAVPVSWT